jgi:hypothetical protein
MGTPKPLKLDEELTVRHLNGQERKVAFDQISGDKLNQVTVRWGLAGLYSVDMNTGQLFGGKPRLKASVWRVIPSDMRRIVATARKIDAERRERMRKNKK